MCPALRPVYRPALNAVWPDSFSKARRIQEQPPAEPAPAAFLESCKGYPARSKNVTQGQLGHLLLLKNISAPGTSAALRFTLTVQPHALLLQEDRAGILDAIHSHRNFDGFEHRRSRCPRNGRLPILNLRHDHEAFVELWSRDRAPLRQRDMSSYWELIGGRLRIRCLR
jgi:hypothetical protein